MWVLVFDECLIARGWALARLAVQFWDRRTTLSSSPFLGCETFRIMLILSVSDHNDCLLWQQDVIDLQEWLCRWKKVQKGKKRDWNYQYCVLWVLNNCFTWRETHQALKPWRNSGWKGLQGHLVHAQHPGKDQHWLQLEFGLNSDHLQPQNIHIPSRQPVLVSNVLIVKVVFALILNKNFPVAFFGSPLGLCLRERNLPLSSLVSLSRQQLLGQTSPVFCNKLRFPPAVKLGHSGAATEGRCKNDHPKMTTGCFYRACICQVFS